MTSQMTSVMFTTAVIVHAVVLMFIFEWVFVTSEEVIDEVFHLDQGLEYCYGNFSYWNPKITTPPGLYLISTLVGRMIFDCNTYSLRVVSLIASAANLYLFARILHHYQGATDSKTIVQALSLSILPPLYFFSFVYYTDMLSMTLFLTIMDLSIRNKSQFWIIFASIVALTVRQTNVVWIGMFLGVRLMEVYLRSPSFKRLKCTKRGARDRRGLAPPRLGGPRTDHPRAVAPAIAYGAHDFRKASRYHWNTRLRILSECVLWSLSDLFAYVFVIFAFIAFLIINGSITVGDKEAHTAAVHLPQVFYFSLFYGFFALPFVLSTLKDTVSYLVNHKIPTVVCVVVFGIIVHFNTIVHPYLLADNRHFTFYIWNRWYGRYWFARYVTVPAYVVFLTSIVANMRKICISYWLPLLPCIFAAIALQRMIEVRYFLAPYYVLRLRFDRPSWLVILVEFVMYVVVNILAFYVFFTKEIYWSDMEGIQRIIW